MKALIIRLLLQIVEMGQGGEGRRRLGGDGCRCHGDRGTRQKPARCCRQIIEAQEPRQETLTTIRYKQWTHRK